jgi:hypothetical protein
MKEIEINKQNNVLCSYLGIGSVWLINPEIKDGYIIGDTWDDSNVNGYNMPDDYRGEFVTMNFPISSIRKIT